jgi:hypothetical protein
MEKRKPVDAKIDSYSIAGEEKPRRYPRSKELITKEEVKDYALPRLLDIIKNGIEIDGNDKSE